MNEHKFWQEVVLPLAGPAYRDLAGEGGQAGSPSPPADPWRGAAGSSLQPRGWSCNPESILPAPGGFPHPRVKYADQLSK